METLALIFAGVSAVTAVLSIIIAFVAKSEVKKLSIQINDGSKRNANSKNKLKTNNFGEVSGVMAGINTGDVNEKRNY